MFNPIKHIKDVVEILRLGGPGKAISAVEINDKNKSMVLDTLGPEAAPYVKEGAYMVEFESLMTIAPAKEFHKYYRFVKQPDPTGLRMTPVAEN